MCRTTSPPESVNSSQPDSSNKCYRLVIETPPISRSLLAAEMGILWLRYGFQYRLIDAADDPSKMPLLSEPTEEHYWVNHFPAASPSGDTGTAYRVSGGLTTVTSDPLPSPSLSNVVDCVGIRNDSSSVASSDTIYECFSSAPKPR